MTNKPKNPPAYPYYYPEQRDENGSLLADSFLYEGMTLRDYFAGQALIAINADGYRCWGDLAIVAYEIADGMLKERDKQSASKNSEQMNGFERVRYV